jgi:LacI family gluconate utilization system Gnt-I transcriptional repressor
MQKKWTRQPRTALNRVRIEEVARVAGVSPMTVSRSFSAPEMVTEKTLKRVQAAVEATGYIPNRIAGSLASSRSRTVGVIIPNLTNSIFADKVQGMSDVLSEAGYQLLVGNSGYAPETEAELVAAFLAQNASAIVVTGATHTERTRKMLAQGNAIVVETWSLTQAPIDMQVGFSNDAAAYAMVQHLHADGYRRIGFVSAPIAENDRALGRLEGYRRAMREHGSFDPRLERQAEFSFRNGAEAMADLIETHTDIDAVFFANDVLAAGALFECRRRGIDVPGQLGIAGFDNLDLTMEIVPRLTTVSIPRYDIGATAARMILQRLADEDVAESADLGFQIIPRDSTHRR